MKFAPPLRTEPTRRSRRAFTLIEVLAALLLMAIVIPVAMQGMSIASRAGLLGQRKAAAMRVAALSENGKAYAIPQDNPFLKTPKAMPEIWAFGFRNPWKISMDVKTGNLWCGDVGWELWEMIHLVEKGSNHGWSVTEATQSVKPELLSPLAPITPPAIAHPHTEAASITGGYVYHGKALPELDGAYIYGDYETGKIWALWHDGTKITRHEEIADTPYAVVTFAQGEDGELYFAHYAMPSTVHRLVRNPEAGRPVSLVVTTGVASPTKPSQRRSPKDQLRL